ncbi:hypothetical protein KVT40_005619 [Elsinoe batatas]|uniref:FAD-binding domain-containing protein n=1 Tax=Elsinoe batatas TaxID=2601811 RepID=A0A8K0KZ59_9PEZI|nr:hypothetical protein KVT40_005619 [Elsinoe batatas]
MATSSTHSAVIIIGAGPVGLLTALNLARLSVPVLVLDDVRAKSMVNNILSYWVGRGKDKQRKFRSGINCGQNVLAETIMEHSLGKYGDVAKVEFGKTLEGIDQDENGVEITCKDTPSGEAVRYRCDWLVGTDGAGSAVRRSLGIEFEGFSWPKEDFVATSIRYPFEKYGFTTANFIMDPVHWAVITVIDDSGLWRCAFGVKAGMTNEDIKAELEEHYKEIFPGWPGEGYELRCARQFRKGRCLLAGDAAHSNNPIGGLGLTTGLLDAGPLGRALAAVIRDAAPDTLLDTWAESRRHKWLEFTNGFSIENKRMVLRGGYSDDPLGIWKLDETSREHGMDDWVKTATPDKKEADLAMYDALHDKAAQMKNRMKQWDIGMDPRWMERY